MTSAELRQRRLALGLTQRALADRLRVTVTTVSRWEIGASPIPPWLDVALRGIELASHTTSAAEKRTYPR